jgi:plastocyanin
MFCFLLSLSGKEREGPPLSGALFLGALCVVPLFLPSAFAGEVTGRVVATNGQGISQAVVFVPALPNGGRMQAAPSSTEIDQIHKEFVPALLPVVVGTEVRFPNRDQIQHHVYSFSRAKNFELPLYKGEDAPPVLFDKVGVVKIGCNIHDWMSAIILVLPTPYFAVTDEAGNFTLSDLPAGAYALAAWHELSQSKPEETTQQIQVGGSPTAVTFTLPLSAPRPRPANRGERGY